MSRNPLLLIHKTVIANIKKKLYLLFWIIFFGYFSFSIFKHLHPSFYETGFNNKRKQVGLQIIDSNLERQGDKFSPNKIWKSKLNIFPGFSRKYVSCYKWNGGIDKECDIFNVMIDSSKAVISIDYYFNQKKINYTLKEFELPKNTTNIYGHSGRKIKSLNLNETREILKQNGIQY